MAGPDGRVLVPHGTKFLGVVTEAQSALGPGEVPFLEVVFETLAAEAWERPIKTPTWMRRPAFTDGKWQAGPCCGSWWPT